MAPAHGQGLARVPAAYFGPTFALSIMQQVMVISMFSKALQPPCASLLRAPLRLSGPASSPSVRQASSRKRLLKPD